MNKNKRGNYNYTFLKSFFHSSSNRLILIFTSIILACIYLYFHKTKDFKIFPSNSNITFDFYNDSSVNGKSKIVKQIISDSAIDMRFQLKKGIFNPFVGLNIGQKSNSNFNIKPYTQLQFEIVGHDIKNLIILIIIKNTYADIHCINNEIFFCANVEIFPEKKQYCLYLNEFKVPDWWYDSNAISPTKNLVPNYQHVLRICFATGLTKNEVLERSLKIYSISLVRNNKTLLLILCICQFLVILCLLAIYYFKEYFVQKTIPVTHLNKLLESGAASMHDTSFIDYINGNFHDNKLTLESVSNYTSIIPRKITGFIQQTFGCNFKSYVNQIRINESKRLLKESELNMGEIAFKVGFNSQSHFNRVFKSLVGINPSEFRGS